MTAHLPRGRTLRLALGGLLLASAPYPLHAAAARRAAPGHGAGAFDLSVAFSPEGGTFYTSTVSVRIGWCDVFTTGRTVKWNGTTLNTSATLGSDPSCSGTYKYTDLSLTMLAGNNTLWAQGCDANGSCYVDQQTFTYSTTDAVPPSASISPTLNGGSATLNAVVTWCDGNALGSARRIVLNGVDVTSSFNYVPGTGSPGTSCNATATSSGTVTLSSGSNTLTAQIQDVAGNWGPVPAAVQTYTYTPAVDVAPMNQYSVLPGPGDAIVYYSMPSYRSLDGDRGVTLVYSSFQARPTAFVSVDVTDSSASPAPKTSIGLTWHGTYQTMPAGQTALYYNTGSGTSRLSAFYGASNTLTGSLDMVAVVTRTWSDHTEQLTAPVRMLIVNLKTSDFGAGWTIPGVEQIYTREGGILVVHGDLTATFYPSYTSCDAVTHLCYYGHSAGDFGTFAFNNQDSTYLRTAHDGTKSYFDGAGRITKVVDLVGDSVLYAYSNGHLSSITDPAGLVTTLTYNLTTGKITGITDPFGRTSTFTVDGNGDLTSIVDPDSVTAFTGTYLTTHRLISYIDRAGGQTDITYDAFGQAATVQSPQFTAEGGQTFRLTSSLASLQAVAEGDQNGGSLASPLPRVIPSTLRISTTDPEGRVTHYAPTRWRTASRTEDPAGYASTVNTNDEGQVISTADPAGNATFYTWTGGDITQVLSPSGTVNIAYNARGQDTLTTGDTPTVHNWYGATGLLDSTAVATDTTRYTYDSRGRPLTVSDPEHHVTTIVYDDVSQWKNTKTVTSGGRVTQYRYDTYGRVLGLTAPDGHETVYAYDRLNRTTSVITPDLAQTKYWWGRVYLDSLTDARGQTYSWSRNALGWPQREVRPGDQPNLNITTAYDRYGRVSSVTNRRLQQISFTYDYWDRVATRTADGQTTTYAYSPDDAAHPTAPTWTAVANGESIDSVKVDGQGHLTDHVTVLKVQGLWQRFDVQPHYDATFMVTGVGIAEPTGRDSVDYTYSRSTDQLTSMGDMARGNTTFTYTHDGLPYTRTLPGGIAITNHYTTTHAVQDQTYSNLTVDNAAGVYYSYDALDRITTRRNRTDDRRREFSYDAYAGWLSGFADELAHRHDAPHVQPGPEQRLDVHGRPGHLGHATQ